VLSLSHRVFVFFLVIAGFQIVSAQIENGQEQNGPAKIEFATDIFSIAGSQPFFPFLSKLRTSGESSDMAPCPTTEFDGAKSFPTGGTSYFVVSGDFNYDGKRDIATASDTGVSILIGDGNGRFAAPKRILLPNLTKALEKADLNNDGIMDLAVAMLGANSGTVAILLGTPSGDFGVANTLPLTGLPQTLRIGDLNGDDYPDIAIAQSGTNSVAVFLGQGNGSFGAVTNYPIGANGYGLVVRDFNNDGKQDMIASSGFNSFLAFFAGQGDGTFQSATSIPMGQTNRNLETGDFNGDGKADIAVVTNLTLLPMRILLGNNDGTFVAQPLIDFDARAFQLAVSDVNNDGKLDLVSSGGLIASQGSASVRLGNGDATFGDEFVFATGATPSAVAVDDFDIDGKPDLAITNLTASDIAIIRGDGTGKFGAPIFQTGGTRANWSAAGDFNGDGKPDLAVVNKQTLTISVMLGNGLGGLNPPTLITQPYASNVIIAADINLDGKIDLVTGNTGNSNNNANVYSYLGNGDGTFSTGTTGSTTSARQFHSMVLANITNDTTPDLVMAGTDSSGRVIVFNGNTGGVFTHLQTVTLAQSVLAVAAGDFNGDGRTDAAATTSQGVAIMMNLPNGTLGSPTYYRAGTNPSFVTTGDFNEDSVVDLAIANDYTNGDVSILLGNGFGGFREPTAYAIGNGPSSIAVRDLNGDGHLDLAVSNSNSNAIGQNKIGILFGDGFGSFVKSNEYIAGQNPRNVVVADFDVDGKPDLATANYTSNDAAILKNNCFSPVSYTFPTVSLANPVTVPEPVSGTVNVNLGVTLSAPSSRKIKVQYFTGASSATGQLDYQSVSGTLVFLPGETAKTVTVPVKADAIYEFDESVDIHLSDPTNVTLANAHSAITITDDDPPPSLSVGDITGAEGNAGNSNFTFPVTVSNVTERPIVVSYSTVSGTATSSVDFVRTNGLLTIPARTPVVMVTVPVIGDVAIEPDETFSLVLSNPTGASIADGVGIGTITNDDVAGSFQFSSATSSISEDAVNVLLTVTRTGGAASGPTVQYSTGGGTATAGQDYRSATDTLTFGANETSKTVTLTIVNDAIDEPDETFNVALSNPTGGATLGSPTVSQVTILDNDPPPDMAIDDVTVAEGNSGTATAVFTVRLSATSGRTITVNYASADITATAGTDYQSVTGTLTFEPSTLTKTIAVPLIPDTAYEPDETFNINLTSPSNAVITDAQGRGTILNDDANPVSGNTLISVNRLGTGSGNDGSNGSTMTPDGRYVAFASSADDIVANDINAHLTDVFVRDTQTGTTTLVSVNQSGTGSGNDRSFGPVISATGRYIAFSSSATNLAPNDSNAFFDVYLRDMQTGTTTLVTYNLDGTAAAGGNANPYSISPDGRYIVFTSGATNLTTVPDTSASIDIFVRDMQTGVNKMLSVNIFGVSPSNQNSYGVPNSISSDGRYFLFESDASNLTSIPGSGGRRAFIRDTQLDTTIPVAVDRLGTQTYNGVDIPVFAGGGRYVCFVSGGNDIVANDNNNRGDVFLRDLQTNTTTLVSVNVAGNPIVNGNADKCRITPDARYVAFSSSSTEHTTVPDTNGGANDIFLRDMQTGTTSLISHNLANTSAGNAFSTLHAISSDGRFVVFQSFATDLTNLPDTNSAVDIFAGDARTSRTIPISINDFGTSTPTVASGNSAVNNDGTKIIFESDAGNIAVGDFNGTTDVFLRNNIVQRNNAGFDFDGDGKTDLSVFRPSNGGWYINRSNQGLVSYIFGTGTDVLTPADFTGDGKADVAFFRPSTGTSFILRSEDNTFYSVVFGTNGDIPVPGDYDGDGKGDIAVFRPSSVTWFISRSSGGTDILAFGAAGDKPVVADYDGDGKADIAIFRPNGASGAEWWVRRSSNASVFALQFGTATDNAVAGDYTGDGKADVAFWRPSTGFWNILRSEDFSYYAFPFGTTGDMAVPGDYDGDGKIDAAVFRPSSSTWFANKSGGGTLIQQFGITGDVPLPNAFVR